MGAGHIERGGLVVGQVAEPLAGGGHVLVASAGDVHDHHGLVIALGLQIGGGIHPDNAAEYLDAGASQVIVTSYVFKNGRIQYENLEKMFAAVGRDRLVLDLSCRKKGGAYYIVTDRWQKFTDVQVTPALLDELSGKCSEFLIHAVDVEGKASGIETELAKMLGAWAGIPVTYAGGVGSLEDVEALRTLGKGRLDVTIGSALDLFGGCIPYRNVVYLR